MDKHTRRKLGIHKARKVLRVYREIARVSGNPEFYENGGEFEKKLIHTRVPCSCPMCGHRREVEGKTRQEKLADIEYEEQLKFSSG